MKLLGNESTNPIISVGDFVRIAELGNPRNEYVEAIAEIDNDCILCLSDGTWVKSSCATKFRVQGEDRIALVDILNETYQ